MKRAAFPIMLIGISLLSCLLIAKPVFANTDVEVLNNGEGSHTNVHVETNTGNNTICVNGKCTTSSGSNGTSHVCVNGKCYDSDSGDLNVQSDDGHDQVHINNNSEKDELTEEPSETPEPTNTVMPSPSVTISPSVAPSLSPQISKMLEEHQKDIDKLRQQMEDHLARHELLLQKFFDSLHSFLHALHLF